MTWQRITLENMYNGEVAEKFNELLQKAVNNFMDPTTEADKPRTITLKVTIKQNPDDETKRRPFYIAEFGEKLASFASVGNACTQIMPDGMTGELVLCEDVSIQGKLFDEEEEPQRATA